MIGILKGLLTTWKTHFQRPVTVQYPDEHLPLSERYWGFPALIWDYEVGESKCVGCGVCEKFCPPRAIVRTTLKDNPNYAEGKSKRKKIIDEFLLDVGRCMVCNICVEVCAFDAIKMSHVHEVSGYSRKDLRLDVDALHKLTEVKAGGD